MAFQGLPPPAHHYSFLHLAASWFGELLAYLLTQRQGLCNHNKRNHHSTFLQAGLTDSCSPGALTSIITLLNHRRLKSHTPTPVLPWPSSASSLSPSPPTSWQPLVVLLFSAPLFPHL